MKGEMTLKILEHIGDMAIGTADLTMAFLESGYGASSRKMMNQLERRQAERFKKHEEELAMKRSRQRFYSMLCRLKKDGLIKAAGENGKSFCLTAEGTRRLLFLKRRRADALPNHSYVKPDSRSGKFTIVVFDIPESEKRKRMWLRSALKNVGFQMIQKSVWMGKVKIPSDFLDDLKNLQLLKNVEIFEISKAGSLQQLV